MFSKLKRCVVRWLVVQLNEEARRRLRESNSSMAIGGQLLEEAKVENYSGDREKIQIGQNTYIRGRLLIYPHGGQIRIGDWSYVGVRTEIWSMETIRIGDRVLISHDVNIHDGTAHSLDAVERHSHFRHIVCKGHTMDPSDIPGVRAAPIVIEDDVWISFGVTILRGVRIGKGSVIAAGSIVTKDVPPGVLYRCRAVPEMVALQTIS